MVARRSSYVPDRGDAIWITLDPQAGHEQAGRRPALVLSHAIYNDRVGLAIVCPITNQAKGYPFEVAIPSGSKVTGVVMADQIKNLDWRVRQAKFIGPLPAEVLEQVVEKLQVLVLSSS